MPDIDFGPMRERVAHLREQGDLPEWAGKLADRAPRDEIAQDFQGTHDIAGAAEALVNDGQIDYTQATSQEISEAIKDAGLPQNPNIFASPTRVIRDAFMGWGNDLWPYVTQGNCYEFVHLAGQFSCDDPMAFSSNWGNSIADVLEPDSVQQWDGSSAIPRGKVIIGIASKSWGGQGQDGTYHFAVSLGGGKVANNRGDGATIEDLSSVFGGYLTVYARSGGRIIYGDYRHFEPRQSQPDETAPPPSTERDTFRPKSAVEQRRPVVAAAALGTATVALIGIFFTFGNDDDPGPPPSSAPTTEPSDDVPSAASSDPATPAASAESVGFVDPMIRDSVGILGPFFPDGSFGLASGPDAGLPPGWLADPGLDFIYSRPDTAAGRMDPAADLLSFGRFMVDPSMELFDDLLGNTEYPCGFDDGTTIVVCPPEQDLPFGPLALVALELDGDVTSPDTDGRAVYAYVTDRDGDAVNNWRPQGGFDWDYFQGTDTWLQLEGTPSTRQWSLRTSVVDANQQVSDVALQARAILRGNAVVFVVPEASIPVDAPWRVTSFLHDGSYAPESSGGDVPGADPTGPLES